MIRFSVRATVSRIFAIASMLAEILVIPCSICGQAGSDPKMAAWLVEHGITSISANIDAIAKIRETVARTEKRIILEAARSRDAE